MADPLHLLHVDPNPAVRDAVATTLEPTVEPLQIASTSDSETALQRLSEDSFQAVISGYDLPSRTGVEFLKTVRERHSNSRSSCSPTAGAKPSPAELSPRM
jgi:DNA-binding NtrC family response regulator